MIHHMQTKQQWSGQLRKPTNICSQKVSTGENAMMVSTRTVRIKFLADKVKLKILRVNKRNIFNITFQQPYSVHNNWLIAPQ